MPPFCTSGAARGRYYQSHLSVGRVCPEMDRTCLPFPFLFFFLLMLLLLLLLLLNDAARSARKMASVIQSFSNSMRRERLLIGCACSHGNARRSITVLAGRRGGTALALAGRPELTRLTG